MATQATARAQQEKKPNKYLVKKSNRLYDASNQTRSTSVIKKQGFPRDNNFIIELLPIDRTPKSNTPRKAPIKKQIKVQLKSKNN